MGIKNKGKKLSCKRRKRGFVIADYEDFSYVDNGT